MENLAVIVGKNLATLRKAKGLTQQDLAREVNYSDGYISVSGFIGTGELSYPNRSRMSFFLNQRYINSRSVGFAVVDAYQTRLMSGRFPFAVLNLSLDIREVDVNVHPSSRMKDASATRF